jgi:hypothetical protein
MSACNIDWMGIPKLQTNHGRAAFVGRVQIGGSRYGDAHTGLAQSADQSASDKHRERSCIIPQHVRQKCAQL